MLFRATQLGLLFAAIATAGTTASPILVDRQYDNPPASPAYYTSSTRPSYPTSSYYTTSTSYYTTPPSSPATYYYSTSSVDYYATSKPASGYIPTATYTYGTYYYPKPTANYPSTYSLCDAQASDQTYTGDLTPPTGYKPVYVALGRGIQAYTCTDSTWVYKQSNATLYDVSCVAYNKGAWQKISQIAYDYRNSTTIDGVTYWYLPPQLTAYGIGATYLGNHYWYPDATGALSPYYDFRPSYSGTYVYVKQAQSYPSSYNATGALPWVKYDVIAGDAANYVYRVETTGGLPAQQSASTTCFTSTITSLTHPLLQCSAPGTTLNVQYAAIYWFYKQ